MVRYRLSILAPALLLATLSMGAATVDTSTRLIDERTKTLTFSYSDTAEPTVGVPVLTLGYGQGFVAGFDRLTEDREYLRYELTHCDRDWQPSTIAYPEYLDGFNEGRVPDGEFSNATSVHYVHYAIPFPSEEMSPKVSGNYLVRVYSEDEPETTLLQFRFVVSEQTADIAATVTSRTDIDFNRRHQQVSAEIDVDRADVRDLFNDLALVAEQNGRPDTRVTITKPLRVSGKRLYYEHLSPLIFRAGNNYRRFESISTVYPGMGVEAVTYNPPYYTAWLATDATRSGQSFTTDLNLAGGYVVREYNSDDSDVDADYVVTRFTLDYPEAIDIDIYIDSEWTQRQLDASTRMRYNPETRRYELTRLLKQGAYSYQYLAVPRGTHAGRTADIEGDYFETPNTYRLYLYHRRPGERYDRLVGVTTLNLQ